MYFLLKNISYLVELLAFAPVVESAGNVDVISRVRPELAISIFLLLLEAWLYIPPEDERAHIQWLSLLRVARIEELSGKAQFGANVTRWELQEILCVNGDGCMYRAAQSKLHKTK